MNVRAFPMPTWPNRGDGWCRWCGEATTGRRRTWHADCLSAYYLHTRPEVQRHFVVKRDGEVCADCGEAPEKWVIDKFETVISVVGWPKGEPWPRYVGIRRASALELEHRTPLWSVATLPDAERRAFFGPENLCLRCPVCHKAKSAAEAAARAQARKDAAAPRLDFGGAVQ